MRTFFVLRKSSFPYLPCRFFRNIFTQSPVMFSTDLRYVICSFTKKACKFAIKRDSKNFLEVTKRMERLQQNSLVKVRFSDSDSGQV